jgi:hypothetical protein
MASLDVGLRISLFVHALAIGLAAMFQKSVWLLRLRVLNAIPHSCPIMFRAVA